MDLSISGASGCLPLKSHGGFLPPGDVFDSPDGTACWEDLAPNVVREEQGPVVFILSRPWIISNCSHSSLVCTFKCVALFLIILINSSY